MDNIISSLIKINPNSRKITSTDKNWINKQINSASKCSTPIISAIPTISSEIEMEITRKTLISSLENIINKANHILLQKNSGTINPSLYLNSINFPEYGHSGIKLDITNTSSNIKIIISQLQSDSENDIKLEVTLKLSKKTNSQTQYQDYKITDLSIIDTKGKSFLIVNQDRGPNLNITSVEEIIERFVKNSPNYIVTQKYLSLVKHEKELIAKREKLMMQIDTVKKQAIEKGIDLDDVIMKPIEPSKHDFSDIKTAIKTNSYIPHHNTPFSKINISEEIPYSMISKQLELLNWTINFMGLNNPVQQRNQKIDIKRLNLLLKRINNWALAYINDPKPKQQEIDFKFFFEMINEAYIIIGISSDNAEYLKKYTDSIYMKNITMKDLTKILALELKIAHSNSKISESENYYSEKIEEQKILLNNIDDIYDQIMNKGVLKFLDRFKYKTEKLRLLRFLRINRHFISSLIWN